MENIDWSKAPEWATKHGFVSYDMIPVWLNNQQYRYVDCRQYARIFSFVSRDGFLLDQVQNVTHRPDTRLWNGSSLPPVGLKVEAHFHADTNPDWLPFTLKYFSEENVVFRGPIVETHMSRCAFDKYGFKYRAIRTPEQIVAEEREHKIRNACTAIARTLDYLKGDIPGGAVARQVVEAMIDAGYAKQVKP